jgi:hypothetical protein
MNPKPKSMNTSASPLKSKKRKPAPEPDKLSRDERFYELFKTALQGLCAQFEDARNPRYVDGKAELERCQDLSRRPWNLATYAASMFEDDEIEAFNQQVEITTKKEEAETLP